MASTAYTNQVASPDYDAERLARELIEDHPVLIQKIAKAIECAPEDTTIALREVLRFLQLVARHKGGQLTPSHRVDLIWHEFILFTKAYQVFCQHHFGRMIHHFPGGSNDEEKHAVQFALTLQAYQAEFGDPEPGYWGCTHRVLDLSNCGPCESF